MAPGMLALSVPPCSRQGRPHALEMGRLVEGEWCVADPFEHTFEAPN